MARGIPKGRPRKNGPRGSTGRLKQPNLGLPNENVLMRRRAILGKPDAKPSELRAAENPLDTMAERGWLDPSLARAGHAYAELYRRAGLYLSRVTANMEEAPETANIDRGLPRHWTFEEIAAVWAVLERRGALQRQDGGDGDVDASDRLKRIWTGLGPKRAGVVHSVCVMESWPFWTMQAVAGRTLEQIPEKWIRDRAVLIEGLTIIRAVLVPEKPRTQAPERDHPFLGGPVVEELVEYVDEEGRPDPVRNRAGDEVEVVRRRRA
jgi:hypothetical protein